MPNSSICRIGKGWVPCGSSPFLLCTLDYLYKHSHSHTGLILLIKNLIKIVPVTSIFAFCLFVWLIQLKCVCLSISPLELFQGIICNIERLRKGNLGALNYLGDVNCRGDLRPVFIPCLKYSK